MAVQLRAICLMAAALAAGVLPIGAGSRVLGQTCPAISVPQPLNTNASSDTGHDTFAQVTTDGTGAWVGVWSSTDDLNGTIGSDPDIVMTRTGNVWGAWTPPEYLTILAQGDSVGDFNPQVTTDGMGTWLAVWEYLDQPDSRSNVDLDVLMARSTNAGLIWTPPLQLNTNAGTDAGNDRNPQIATDAMGHWVAVWSSNENIGGTLDFDTDILVSVSIDAGMHWTDPAALNASASADERRDEFPQIATDELGHWVAVWQTMDISADADPAMEWDLFVARSEDNGLSWFGQRFLNTIGPTDQGDDEQPQITTDGQGTWIAVWHSTENLQNIGLDADIFYSVSNNNGTDWTPPKWLNTTARNDGTRWDVNPQLATDGQKHWVAVWEVESPEGGPAPDMDVQFARSQDAGETPTPTWTVPVFVNLNAASDSGNDSHPQITTDGAGTWVVAWDADDLAGNPADPDKDILFSRFVLTPYDCNENGIPDECDIAAGTSDDCNGNGLPDECEIDAAALVDCSVTPPPCRAGPFFCLADCLDDLNGNGIADCCEEATCVPCPPGEVVWIDPPHGVVDARQPHELADAGAQLGIQTLELAAPPNARDHCWTFCDTTDGEANTVATVVEEEAGSYTITLERPITPGELITLTYTDFVGEASTGTFASLPADVNADRVADADDLTAMIDACLDRVYSPPFPPPNDRFNCDLDHSGTITALDLARLVDLLTGAGQLDPWMDETVPDSCAK